MTLKPKKETLLANFAVEWIILLFRICKVPGSNWTQFLQANTIKIPSSSLPIQYSITLFLIKKYNIRVCN